MNKYCYLNVFNVQKREVKVHFLASNVFNVKLYKFELVGLREVVNRG